jgi:hypothetical protein
MRKNLLLMILFVLVGGASLHAQNATSASIVGVVRDAKGGALPGATVLAVHTPSGTQYGIASRNDGRYTLPNVRIGGPYKLTVSFIGYETQEKNDIFLSLGNVSEIDFSIAETGTQLNEVVVSGVIDPVLSADRTGAATNITKEQLTQLPTLSRSFSDFTRLTPQSNGLSFGGRSSSFNNITIDGALFNNSFGLSSTVGGQANAQPISLDAFEQIQVNIAPYDVRQGAFTGASINAVTRSGTNEFSGSIFKYWRNENTIGYQVGGIADRVVKNSFSNEQTGFRVGGPIIKNKLFFFLNGETERATTPATTFVADRGTAGTNVSRATAAELDGLSTFLRNKYNYETGPYENYPLLTSSDKFTVKIDYNINSNHRINVKYNYLVSYRDVPPSSSGNIFSSQNGRAATINSLPFQSSLYRINNNLNSVIAELNSTFGTKFSNTFNIGYSAFRDFRESSGGVFPTVDIGRADNTSLTSFGFETFSAGNILNTNVFQFSDNFTAYMGSHTITLGTSNEFYDFKNGFAQQFYGQYTYQTLQDFYDDANGVPGKSPVNYQLRYSGLADGSFPFVYLKASQVSAYLQDEWNATDKLKVTYGLRADLPIWNTTGDRNTTVEGLTFRNGEKIDVSKLPDSQVLLSPRIGFNFDVFGDRKTTIRGGTGIFTGRVPFVWLSNQLSNNGLLFGTLNVGTVGGGTGPATSYDFSPDVSKYIPTTKTLASTYTLNSTVTDFKVAQIFRANVGVDQVLGNGYILTFDGMFTKELNNIYIRDANLKSPSGTLKNGSEYFGTFAATGNNTAGFTSGSFRTNPTVLNALVLDNTNEGFSYTLTAQIRKRTKNLDAMLAYNYGQARDVNSGGSTAGGIYGGRPVVGDPSFNSAAISDFNLKHRLVGSVNYTIDYSKFASTTIGLFLTANTGNHYSYIYSNDANGDGQTGNDLMYIPQFQNEINLAATNGRTAAQVWQQLDAFIAQDPYLSKHRGQFAERNGAVTPGVTKLDMRILQDFYLDVKGKRNTIQLSLDIFNLGNFIDPNWGVVQTFNTRAPLSVAYNSAGVPTYTFPLLNANSLTPLNTSFRNDTGLTSRWQMQFGIRYIFN